MKFIASKIHWIGIILLVGFTAAAAGLYFDTPSTPRKKTAPTAKAAEIKSAAADIHAGCNHNHASPQNADGGCGTATAAGEGHGCCGGKQEASTMILPAGHPPIEGYTVATDAHAGCAHAAETGAEKTKAQP